LGKMETRMGRHKGNVLCSGWHFFERKEVVFT
jgi:hypothetical protein